MAATCAAQQQGALVYVEGTILRADGVPLPGAVVNFSNGAAVLTNQAGHYFAVLPSGFSGHSDPSLAGVAFSPSSRFYTNLTADQSGQDFGGGTYTVSGKIANGINSLDPAVYFDALGNGVVAGGDGTYSITIPDGVTGTATPLSAGITFNPSSRAFSTTSFANQDYAFGDYKAFGITWGLNASGPDCFKASTYLYPPQTPRIFVSTQALGVTGDTVVFSWYDPAGVLRHQTQYTFTNSPFTTGPCAVSSIPVAGTDVAQSPGIWQVSFTAMDAADSVYRLVSIPFAVLPQNQPASNFGSMAHLAVGDGWETTIQLLNSGITAAGAGVGFFADDGTTLALPVVSQASSVAFLNNTLAPHSLVSIGSASTNSLQTGYAQMSGDLGVGGFIRFRYAPRDQEAIVPMETRNASSYVFSFDNTNGFATGVALANLAAVPASIAAIIRNDSGAQIGSGSVSLVSNGHASFVLSDQFASTANVTGTIEFDTPPGGRITVLGMRFPPGGRFTTIPVIASTDPGGGTMAHLTVGDGWTSTIELVNNSGNFAHAHLKLFDDSGAPLSLPLTIAGAAATTSTVDQTMAPHTRVVIQSAASDTDPLQEGSAQLTSDGSVSGFIRFRYGPRDQDAIVPLESGNAASYLLAFDNSNGLAAGVAVANSGGAPVNIPVVIRDDNGAQLGLGTISLPGNGHSAFVLSDRFPVTSGKVGSVEFGTPASQPIGVLGIRFPASGMFSTIPVVAVP